MKKKKNKFSVVESHRNLNSRLLRIEAAEIITPEVDSSCIIEYIGS